MSSQRIAQSASAINAISLAHLQVPDTGEKAVDAAVKFINDNGGIAGRPIELTTIDTESKVDVGVLRLRQLIQDKRVDFVIGSQYGGVAIASNPICRDLGILCLSLSRTDEITGSAANPYVFRLIVNTTLTASAAGSWMIERTGKNWTALYADYVWGASNRDLMDQTGGWQGRKDAQRCSDALEYK